MRGRVPVWLCAAIAAAMLAKTPVKTSARMLAGVAIAQTVAEPRYAAAEPMPLDRADESYAIYSMLLTSGPIEWRDAPRRQWLVEDTTTATPLDSVCHPTGPGPAMDPHTAVTAPEERQAEWHELLEDFDRHCHDVIKLESADFHVALPLHVLDEAARNRYRSEQGGRRQTDAAKLPEFPDASGLHRFSEVYFNSHHTLALVEQGMWCGGLCGNWSWVVLERRDGAWHMLPWVHSFMIS